MPSGFARHAIVLGLLTAVGPFAIDMYLPAMPSIAAALGTDREAAQFSLIAFFTAVGLCQIVYGPLSDMLGRRRPLYFGMALYFVGAVGCALAPTIAMLIAWRFVQGIGACAGMTIPRAVVRDLHTGPDAARLISLVMLVFSVSPLLAPLIGSVIAEAVSWRAIFWCLAGLGLIGLLVVALFLHETLPAEARIDRNWGAVFRGYGRLLRDHRFLGISFIGGSGLAGFFVYIIGSPFLFIEHFGLPPTIFSLVFASNAVAFIGLAQFNAAAARRFGMDAVMRTAVRTFAGLTMLLLIITLAGLSSLVVFWVFIFASFGCLGFIIPLATVLALEDHAPIAGMASSLLGTVQMLTGAAVAASVSLFSAGSVVTISAALAACGGTALVLSILTLRRPLARSVSAR